MKLVDRLVSESARRLWLAAACATVLFLGFFSNSWGVADPGWFADHQRDTEGMVVGRLVKSRQDGILSAAGFNGAGVPDLHAYSGQTGQIRGQYETYLDGGSFQRFSPYLSQHGGQGMVFSALDRLLPFSPDQKLRLFYAITALLSALALTAIVAWFCAEFGVWVALCVALSMVLSRWLTVFGRNLWWSMWALYLPMVVVLHVLRTSDPGEGRLAIRLAVGAFGALLVKCFINGYEYVTATLVMTLVPVVYYAVRDGWGLRRVLRIGGSTALAGGSAVLTSLLALSLQIGQVRGDFMDGVSYVLFTLGKRTHEVGQAIPERYAESLEAGVGEVVSTYLRGAYFDLENYISASGPVPEMLVFAVDFWQLVVLFLAASVFVMLLRRGRTAETAPKSTALVWATWFSVLAPLSWFVIFKAHSYVHTHMNHLLWQMPFTFFGFAVCGLLARDVLQRIRSRKRSRSQ